MKANVEDFVWDFFVDQIPHTVFVVAFESFLFEIIVRLIVVCERVMGARIDKGFFVFFEEFFLDDFGHIFVTVAFVKDPFVSAGRHRAFLREVPFGSIVEMDYPEFGSIGGEGFVEFPGLSVDVEVLFVRPITPPFEEEPAGEVFVVGVGGCEGIRLVLIFGAAVFDGEIVDAGLVEARNEIVDEFYVVFNVVCFADEDEVVLEEFVDDVVFWRLPMGF
jgi:hypothetical protein